ncbi:MAG: copper amine oxidase N-terminal domain-containing protein [Clostridiales bacterium]|jgi:hypothetical protein|nr:copper amine oxidase N-terminal domain-containing protein [Clostridiales bacterium]
MKKLLQVTVFALLTMLALSLFALPSHAAVSGITSTSQPTFALSADQNTPAQAIEATVTLTTSAASLSVEFKLTGNEASNFYLTDGTVSDQTITVTTTASALSTSIDVQAQVGIAAGKILTTLDDASIVVTESGSATPSFTIPITIDATSLPLVVNDITSTSQPTFAAGADENTAAQAIDVEVTLLSADPTANLSVEFTLDGAQKDTFSLAGGTNNGQTTTITASAAASPVSVQAQVVVAAGKTVAAGDDASVIATVVGTTYSCTIPITIGAAPPPPSNAISGTISLWANNTKSNLGGAYIYVYNNSNGGYVGYTTSAGDGTYTVNIPAGSVSSSGYRVHASSNFIMARLRLNEAETAIEASSVYRIVTASTGGVANFTFVNPITITGKIVDGATGNPIQNATVGSWDSVLTQANGTFEAQTSVSATGSRGIYVYAYASGYYSTSLSRTYTLSIDDFKKGSLDIGEIGLQKIPTTGVYSNRDKNSFIVTPNFVVPNEVSRATLKLNANAASVQTNQIITVETTGSAEIKVTELSDIAVTKNGVKVGVNSFRVVSNNKLEITMDIDPAANYQFVFGIKAPGSGESYTAAANVGGTVIDRAIVILHDLDLTVPPEVKPNQEFVVYGDVVMDDSVDLELVIKDMSGTPRYTDNLRVTKYMGFHYKFENVSLPAEGNYVATVTSNKGRSVEANIHVVDDPIVVTNMSLKDSYNQVSISTPAPGAFLTFTGWVDGSLMSMDYRNLEASVTLGGGISDVDKVQFIMKTSHGTFFRPVNPASLTKAEFTQLLNSYRGTGKADILYEVTKKDGSVLTFVVGKIVILIDPSGYIYDATTNEKLEGAEVTLYYKDESGVWAIWPAELYDQINPMKSDKDGKYGWMVPEGEYHIKVKLEDYVDYDMLVDGKSFGGEYGDGILRVLPEQTEINIGLTPVAEPEEPEEPEKPEKPEKPEEPEKPTVPTPGGSGGGSSSSGSSSSGSSSGTAAVVAQTAPRVTMTSYATSLVISKAIQAGQPIVIKLQGSMNTAEITGAKLNNCAKLNLPVTITRDIYSVVLTPEAVKALKLTDSQVVEVVVSNAEGASGANADKLRLKNERNSQLLTTFYDVEILVNKVPVESYGDYVIVRIDCSGILGLTDYEKSNMMAVELNGLTCLGGKFDGDVFEFAILRGGRYGLAVLPAARRVELTINKNEYSVNGVQYSADVAPIIYESSTMVPIRFVAESLGAEVAWNAVLRSVSISLLGNLFNMTIGQILPGMAVPPMIINDRTLVPLRYVSETLGATVYWHDATKSIEIFYAGN